MWLITTTGFYSIVQKPGEKDLTIRSRVRKDLEALRDKYLPDLGEIVRNENTDYRYRAKVSHADLAKAATQMGSVKSSMKRGGDMEPQSSLRNSPWSQCYKIGKAIN